MLKYLNKIRGVKESTRLWIVCAICFMLVFALSCKPAYADDGEEIRVEDIQPNLKSGHLTFSAKFKNLFSRKTLGIIQTGLASIVRTEVKIVESGNKNIYTDKFEHRISYNLWEERYTIQSEDTTITINDLDNAVLTASGIKDRVLVKDSMLRDTFRYTIQMRVEIIPISTAQGENLAGVQNESQTEGGFGFNVGSLVSFFADRNKPQEYRSGWHTSKPFTISDLR
jgi:hypothetical protein